MTATSQARNVSEIASWRVAIVDDVYADPNRKAVENGLAQFCAEIGTDDALVKTLNRYTECNFADAGMVTDAGIVALYQCRDHLTGIAGPLEELFLDFDQRRKEVMIIEENLKAHGFSEGNIKTFRSVKDLFSGEPFQLVLLDLLLAKGEDESQEIAKQIYEKFKAFILLMSNSPVNPDQVEGFRRKTRLLTGFFDFRTKAELCDGEKFRIKIKTLPKDAAVCHAVHNFVIALESALGGGIDEPPMNEAESPIGDSRSILCQFMHTLRGLGLHDYALLCELTLRNEGHPLGDYLMRLLASHLLAQLRSHQEVQDAVAALDQLRFTEFLPFVDDRCPSFHSMYANATTEAITGPWKPHPWSVVRQTTAGGASTEALSAETGETEDLLSSPTEAGVCPGERMSVESEILQLLGFEDDQRQLPYVQLGDLFIKDGESLVFAVLSASCELQYVPTEIHKDRERLRDETVLLVPGRLRSIGAAPAKKSQTTAALIEWNETQHCVDWFDRKLLGVPHCSLRKLLEERGYRHHRRLQTARALELQQAVLSKLSRIGLEVRPPFPRDISITLFARNEDQSFAQLGEEVTQGGLLFHGRKPDQRVLVLRSSAFFRFTDMMKSHAHVVSAAAPEGRLKASLLAATDAFLTAMCGLNLPIEIPTSAEPKAIHLVARSGKKQRIDQVALRFGAFDEAPVSKNRDLVFCLSVEEE